ncbi:MAG: hypothetical protein IMY72_10895 [Bacteroidetes bacterium]|nr:hypothetical protein [Bacteroidota bacterium]
MKKILFLAIAIGFITVSCTNNSKIDNAQKETTLKVDTTDATNNFYDNEITHELNGNDVEVLGEVANPGKVYFSKLPQRSVIIKEAKLKDNNEIAFVGAYRYDGYSIYDILNERILKKANQEEFPPIIDLYVEISNDKGESVLLSWAEIYYPIYRHNIIIATKVMHIVPSKSKDLWPLPTETKLIVGTDLITERNISNPTKIIVKSLDDKFKIKRDIKPLYSKDLKIYNDKELIKTLTQIPKNLKEENFSTIFYGRGRGIHSTSDFIGAKLKDLLITDFEFNKKNIQNGMFVLASKDGYRSAFTYSEVMNRNDQSEILLIDKNNYENAGRFSIFPSCDFFSDRAMKALNEIHFRTIKH